MVEGSRRPTSGFHCILFIVPPIPDPYAYHIQKVIGTHKDLGNPEDDFQETDQEPKNISKNIVVFVVFRYFCELNKVAFKNFPPIFASQYGTFDRRLKDLFSKTFSLRLELLIKSQEGHHLENQIDKFDYEGQ